MVAQDLEAAFERVERVCAASGLPAVTTGRSYGTPALLVRGKSFCRMKDTETLVLSCPLELKELLMEAAPDVYFETDHYTGYPAVLVRLAAIGDEELAVRLEDGWRFKAPKTLAQRRTPAGG